jgi:hypothetical protein
MKVCKRIGLICFAVAVCAVSAGVSAEPKVEMSLDISEVWSGHPVGFCLLTEGGYQYAAYYDADRRMTVASRRLDAHQWKYQKLDSRLGWDSHNYIRMAIDESGRLHLAGNMHCAPLVYFRTEKPGDITTFKRIEKMTGELEQRCTYPTFIKGAKGEMIFRYRDGGSGNGNEIYNVYDAQSQKWRRLLDVPLTDGRGLMNAYPQGPVKGPDGWFHLTWVWRDTPDCQTNHDLSYAKSPDMVEWRNAAGEVLSLPITLDTPRVVIDAVPAKGGIVNGTGKPGFDHKGRLVVAYHKFDADGNTQAYVARLEAGTWNIQQVSKWNYRWYFSGGGSIEFEISLGTVQCEKDGTLSLAWRHSKYGSGVWKLDEETLKVVETVPPRTEIPTELAKVESDFEGMQVRWAPDSGEHKDAGARYIIRWETLGRNRDRARSGPLPGPSMLRLYRFTEDSQ